VRAVCKRLGKFYHLWGPPPPKPHPQGEGTRGEVRSAKIRNYTPMPNHWMNRRLEDVWLAKK
jgi:hypothetical protein